MQDIINRIEILIELECLSTNAFAHKASIDPGNLGKMLAGKQKVTDGTLRKIADAIGCSFEWLKYGEGEMFNTGNPTMINSLNENTNINDSHTIDRLLGLLEEKDRQIAEKDKQIQTLLALLSK